MEGLNLQIPFVTVRSMFRRPIFFAFCLTIILFVVHIVLMNGYGINWDFHHVFFAGLYHTKHDVPPSLWQYLPFVDPDPRRMVETPFGPLQSVIPALSYTVFFEKLHVLPWDSAWNLPAVVMGVSGVFILFLFLNQAMHQTPALIAMVFLALYPRYWGDLHTNVKDVTTAAAYTLSMFLAWRAVNRRTVVDILTAGILCGITFNFKVNAIFIPVIVGMWTLWLLVTPAKKYLLKPIASWTQNVITPVGGYFLIAMLSSFAIWAVFWKDPYNHLAYLIRFFQFNTINMEVVLGGNWFCSGVSIPWYYPFWYLAIVTPIPILTSFLIGLIVVVVRTFRFREPLFPLLLLWFFVPLLRFMLPATSVIDGIRHFEEVVYPLCAIAAIGAYIVLKWVARVGGFPTARTEGFKLNLRNLVKHMREHWREGIRVTGPILILATCINLVIPIITYHPYQLSYYNELVGGIRGALGSYDIDYWGISQKQAVQWINENAPKNAVIHIVMTADTAGKYLRPDLLTRLNTTDWDHADYVVLLNRQSFFYRYFFIHEYMLYHTPVHTISNQGVPFTFIYDNKTPITKRQDKWWKNEDPCVRRYWQ